MPGQDAGRQISFLSDDSVFDLACQETSNPLAVRSQRASKAQAADERLSTALASGQRCSTRALT